MASPIGTKSTSGHTGRLPNLVSVVTASRLSPYFTSHLLPNWAVPRTGTGQRVRDLMAQGVAHLGFPVEFGQDRGEEDRAPRVVAQPEGALAAVEGEAPVVETVEVGAGLQDRPIVPAVWSVISGQTLLDAQDELSTRAYRLSRRGPLSGAMFPLGGEGKAATIQALLYLIGLGLGMVPVQEPAASVTIALLTPTAAAHSHSTPPPPLRHQGLTRATSATRGTRRGCAPASAGCRRS